MKTIALALIGLAVSTSAYSAAPGAALRSKAATKADESFAKFGAKIESGRFYRNYDDVRQIRFVTSNNGQTGNIQMLTHLPDGSSTQIEFQVPAVDSKPIYTNLSGRGYNENKSPKIWRTIQTEKGELSLEQLFDVEYFYDRAFRVQKKLDTMLGEYAQADITNEGYNLRIEVPNYVDGRRIMNLGVSGRIVDFEMIGNTLTVRAAREDRTIIEIQYTITPKSPTELNANFLNAKTLSEAEIGNLGLIGKIRTLPAPKAITKGDSSLGVEDAATK